MKAFGALPEGYKKIYSVDLQKDKKKALFINALSLLIAALLAVPIHFLIPISNLFAGGSGTGNYMLKMFILIILMVAYILLHELVHGVAMKICGTKKVKYGFTGLYAFAGSDDYYDKSGYIFIALAPVALWGMIIAIINLLVPDEWFWVIYMIQIFNISGAAGDFFVTARFSFLPKDILIKDYGVGMTVYSKNI